MTEETNLSQANEPKHMWPQSRLILLLLILSQHLHHRWLSSFSFCRSSSGWREESVEIERKCVKLFISAVSFECSEFGPPWHSSVPSTVLVLKRIVQKYRYYQPNSWRRQEYRVEEIVELHSEFINARKKELVVWCIKCCCFKILWWNLFIPIQPLYEQGHEEQQQCIL